MGRNRVTVNTVADAAQVSRQTVTNALRHPERVKPETLARVRAEIARLGYEPSAAAQSLQSQRAGAIGIELNVLGPDYHNAVMDPFLVALSMAAPGHDFHMVTFGSSSESPTIDAYRQMWGSRAVDAFVIADTHTGDPRPQWLRDQGIPFASFGRDWDEPAFTDWVDVDGHHGTTLATRHCHQAGYHAIGYLGSPEGLSVVADARRQGWFDACLADGLEAGPAASAPDELDKVGDAADRVVDQVGRGGAVVCATDVFAIGVLHAIWRAGLKPGIDVGIVGFDDSELARMHGLTSVAQPMTAIAGHVLDLVSEAMTGHRSRRTDGILLKPELTIRASTEFSGIATTSEEGAVK